MHTQPVCIATNAAYPGNDGADGGSDGRHAENDQRQLPANRQTDDGAHDERRHPLNERRHLVAHASLQRRHVPASDEKTIVRWIAYTCMFTDPGCWFYLSHRAYCSNDFFAGCNVM